MSRSKGATINDLLARIDTAEKAANAAVQAKADTELVMALTDGTYGPAELDLLFSIIGDPLYTSVVVNAAGIRSNWNILHHEPPEQDAFFLAVTNIAMYGDSFPSDVSTIDLFDLSDQSESPSGMDGMPLAHVGLVRRLVKAYGLDRLDEGIEAVRADRGVLWTFAESQEEVARYLRLVFPIERDHFPPLLMFFSPTG